MTRSNPTRLASFDTETCPECGGAVVAWNAKVFGGEDALLRQSQQCGWRLTEKDPALRVHV